jgi:hypothetical protein
VKKDQPIDKVLKLQFGISVQSPPVSVERGSMRTYGRREVTDASRRRGVVEGDG